MGLAAALLAAPVGGKMVAAVVVVGWYQPAWLEAVLESRRM